MNNLLLYHYLEILSECKDVETISRQRGHQFPTSYQKGAI